MLGASKLFFVLCFYSKFFFVTLAIFRYNFRQVQQISKLCVSNCIYSQAARTNVHLQHERQQTLTRTIAANVRVRVSVNKQAKITPGVLAQIICSEYSRQCKWGLTRHTFVRCVTCVCGVHWHCVIIFHI